MSTFISSQTMLCSLTNICFARLVILFDTTRNRRCIVDANSLVYLDEKLPTLISDQDERDVSLLILFGSFSQMKLRNDAANLVSFGALLSSMVMEFPEVVFCNDGKLLYFFSMNKCLCLLME